MATFNPNLRGLSNSTINISNGLREVKASIVLKANHLSVSSDHAKTRTSLSCRKAVPVSIDVRNEEYYHRLGGLDIINRDCPVLESHEWSRKQIKLRGFCTAAVSHELGHTHSYLIELWLVANPAPTFRPCILISAATLKTKSALQKYLMRRPKFVRKLAECELDLHVIHSEIMLSANPSTAPPEAGILAIGPNTSRETILANVPGGKITVTDELTGETRNCVAGGVVLVGNCAYILTTRHAWASPDDDSAWHGEPEKRQTTRHYNKLATAFSIYQDENCSGGLATDDDSFDSDELLSSSDASSEVDTLPPIHHVRSAACPDHTSSLVDDAQNVLSEGLKLANAHISMTAVTVKQQSLSSMSDTPQTEPTLQTISMKISVSTHSAAADWILATLSDVERDCSVSLLNKINGQRIADFHRGSTSTLDVYLALPNGIIFGRLHPSTVSYAVGGREYALKAITLRQPLGKGNSGAWVTHRNQLCGVIMAVNKDMPEAFMLPIGDIVKDIEKVCKASVNLPEADRTLELSTQTENTDIRNGKLRGLIEADDISKNDDKCKGKSAEPAGVLSQQGLDPTLKDRSCHPTSARPVAELPANSRRDEIDHDDHDQGEEEKKRKSLVIQPQPHSPSMIHSSTSETATVQLYSPKGLHIKSETRDSNNVPESQARESKANNIATGEKRKLGLITIEDGTVHVGDFFTYDHKRPRLNYSSSDTIDTQPSHTTQKLWSDFRKSHAAHSPAQDLLHNFGETQYNMISPLYTNMFLASTPPTTISDNIDQPKSIQSVAKPVHREVKQHFCDQCSSTKFTGFSTANDLARHRRGVHGIFESGDKIWRCRIEGCAMADKIWPRRDNFQSHLKRMHFDNDDKKARDFVDTCEESYDPNLHDLLEAMNTGNAHVNKGRKRIASFSLPTPDRSIPLEIASSGPPVPISQQPEVHSFQHLSMIRPGDAHTAPPNPDSRLRQRKEMQEQDESLQQLPPLGSSTEDFGSFGAVFSDSGLEDSKAEYDWRLVKFKPVNRNLDLQHSAHASKRTLDSEKELEEMLRSLSPVQKEMLRRLSPESKAQFFNKLEQVQDETNEQDYPGQADEQNSKSQTMAQKTNQWYPSPEEVERPRARYRGGRLDRRGMKRRFQPY